MSRAVVRLVIGVALSLAAGSAVRADAAADILARVAEKVAQYYANVQSIVAEETMRIQPERRDMMPEGIARVLTYDLHLDWTPPVGGGRGEAKIVRELLKVNGRAPKPGAKSEDTCMDPEPISPEPLSMFLAGNQSDFIFTLAGRSKMDGRAAVMIDYRERVVGKPSVKWKDTCVSVDLPGWGRGRAWIDAETNDVLRIDESVSAGFPIDIPPKQAVFGRPPFMSLEQSTSSIRYQAVVFHDPEERLMLPRSVETTSAWTNAGSARMRLTQTFAHYRRFLGDSHMVATPVDR
jgi:hypothetical protein